MARPGSGKTRNDGKYGCSQTRVESGDKPILRERARRCQE